MLTKINLGWSPQPGQAISGDRTITHDGRDDLDVTITGGATDQAINFDSIATARVGLLLLCDRALTLQFNDGTTPDATIVLVAGEPYIWTAAPSTTAATDPLSPITDDITAIYATLAAGANATLNIRTLKNNVAP